MKYRVLDVMNDALGLVKKSDLGGATALIRKALSGETAPEGESGDPRSAASPSIGEGHSAAAAAPAGRNLARSSRPADHAARPARCARPEAAPDLGERFLKRAYRGAARARSTIGSMSRPITRGESWRWCSCCMAARKTRKISRSARG